MKSTLQFIAILLAASFLSSCGNGGKSVSEVKLIPVKSGKDFQYIDKEGKIVINPQFSEATVFRNGLALVKTSGDEPKWGFISEDGKFAITPSYKAATVFSDDLAWVVTENGAPTAINSKGEIKFTLQDAEQVNNFSEGLTAYSVIDSIGVKWGFVDKEGKVKINPQFTSTGRFSEGKCAVENSDGKWGFIDKEGKLIINYQFEETFEMFLNGKAVVSLNDKAGLIDENGKYVVNPQFASMLNDGVNYLIEQDGKFGWCDKDGKIIINPQFERAFPFTGHDLAAVQSGMGWGYVDKEGKIVINPQFDIAFPFNGKLALVQSGGKVGFIDKEGKYVINPQFDDISQDFVTYMFSGYSEYESVETDYFNINAIVSRINVLNPEGLALTSKFSEVLTKFKQSESDFSQYQSEYLMISEEPITNDAELSFWVLGTAFQDVQDGWYTKKVFNPNAIVQGFAYAVNLIGKGYGKEKDVKDAIEKSFNGFKKDETQSTPEMNIYKNEKQTINSYTNGSMIVIVISNLSNESEIKQNENEGD